MNKKGAMTSCLICGNLGSFKPRYHVRSQEVLCCSHCTGCFRPQIGSWVPESNERAQISAFSKRYVESRRSIRAWLRVEASRIVRLRSRYAPTGGRLLEIGCSTGELLVEFKKAGYQVRGIELSAAAAEFAQNEYELDVSSVNLDSLGISTFDTIVAIHTLEHIPDQVGFVNRIASVLTPGGLAIIEVPSLQSWSVRLKGNRADIFSDEHVVFHTIASLRGLFEQYGFEIVRIRSYETLSGLFNALLGYSGIMTAAAWLVKQIRRRSKSMAVAIESNTGGSPTENVDLSRLQPNDHAISQDSRSISVGRFMVTGAGTCFGLLITPLRWAISKLGLGGSIVLVARRIVP
jgi:SAM-dependent methyltransferase